MRILGQRSLVSFLKAIVDISFILAIGLTVLVVVAFALIATFGATNMSMDLPARFDIDPSAYQITPRDGSSREVVLEEIQGEVLIRGVNARQAVQAITAGLLALGVGMFMLWQFRGMFRTLKDGQPFVQANVRRIRMVGLVLMFGELLRAAAVAWTSYDMGRKFVSENVRFRADFEPSMLVIFAGLLLLVLAEVFREAASMKRDLETAREIQFELVPAEEFRQDGITVRSRMRPANTVGGDYYDVIPLGEGKVAVVQGDVAGKGLPAALLMAVLQGSLRTLVTAGLRGSRLVSALNDYLNDNTPSNRMVTLFYGELDVATGELTYVNAGHNPPFLIRRDGSLGRPGGASMVLGILPGMQFEESELRLEAGERLLLFTDGVSEAFDPKDTEYGDQRVSDYLQRRPGDDAETLVAGLVEDVLAFCRPSRPGDDMTLTLISRH